MKYKNILITGGAGFIGSNLAVYIKKKYKKARVICLDNLIRKGSELNLPRLKSADIEFIRGDVRRPKDLKFGKEIDLLIECSAEPSVLAEFSQHPIYVIDTNLGGMINCLELARKKKADVIFLSTSRVYSYNRLNQLKTREAKTRLEWSPGQKSVGFSARGIDIDFPLEGAKSLYGATKLAGELLLTEYITNYGIKGIVNRCGVIAGPWQFGKVDQGVFSLWMKHHYFQRPLSYIGWGGRGKQVRDLLHVDDLCRLLDIEINNMRKVNGKAYNVGGGKKVSLSLCEATKICEEITGNKIDMASEKRNRPMDVAIYITDNSRVTKDLNWEPKIGRERIMEDIYVWLKSIGKDWD